MAVRYSPQELEIWLVDGKDGVEFQPYQNLPHVKVVSLQSAPELSRSILSELDGEKERRNSIFNQVGVSDFIAYRQQEQPLGNLPRIILIVDEYQELFIDDKEGEASQALLELASQGRSTGIHLLLGSQRQLIYILDRLLDRLKFTQYSARPTLEDVRYYQIYSIRVMASS